MTKTTIFVTGATKGANVRDRIISGLSVEWDTVGHASLGPMVVERGALFADNTDHLRMLLDHDRRQPFGVFRAWSNVAAGLHTAFDIAPTPLGDQALAEAHSGVRDGLSIGIELEEWSWKADDEFGDLLVVKAARLIEVSLVAFPAYANARTD